jgi:hypothetical protein
MSDLQPAMNATNSCHESRLGYLSGASRMCSSCERFISRNIATRVLGDSTLSNRSTICRAVNGQADSTFIDPDAPTVDCR